MCNLTWIEAQFPGYNVSRRGAWSVFPYTCLKKSTSRHSSYRWREEAPHVETEKADCGCLEANSMGACVRWYCREYDDAGLQDVEHEYYDATQLSSSGSRVDAWRGDIDSRGEFEMSECICTVPSANDMLCEKWECFEKGTAYFFPNLWWSALHVTLIILGPVFVFALADEETSGSSGGGGGSSGSSSGRLDWPRGDTQPAANYEVVERGVRGVGIGGS